MTRRDLESNHGVNLGDLRDLCRELAGSGWIGYSAASLSQITPALVADLIDLIPQDKETAE